MATGSRGSTQLLPKMQNFENSTFWVAPKEYGSSLLKHRLPEKGHLPFFQVDGSSAVIEFLDPTSAEKFCASTNRKMMDLSLLNVSRI